MSNSYYSLGVRNSIINVRSKVINPILKGPTFMTSSNLYHLLQALPLSRELGEDANIQSHYTMYKPNDILNILQAEKQIKEERKQQG